MNLYKLIREIVVGVLLSILVLTAFGIVRLMSITTMPGRFYVLPLATITVGGFLTWKTIRRPVRWGIGAALFLLLVASLLVLATQFSLVHLASGQFAAVRTPRFHLDARTAMRLGYAALLVAAAVGSVALHWLGPKPAKPPSDGIPDALR